MDQPGCRKLSWIKKSLFSICLHLKRTNCCRSLLLHFELHNYPVRIYSRFLLPSLSCKIYRELKQQRPQRQRERQKSNRFRLAKQQLCTYITLFCTFLCRHCTTTTWNCLFSCFVEDASGNTRQLCFSFPELWYSLLEFNSCKIFQHLTNWTRWNKRD